MNTLINQTAIEETTHANEPVRKPRMRGIREAIEEVKAYDPETILTYDRLLRIVHRGDIPSLRLGNRYFINMDILYSYLYSGSPRDASRPNSYGGIRVIKE